MIETCFGSTGAARVLATADRGVRLGRRVWIIGDVYLEYVADHNEWIGFEWSIAGPSGDVDVISRDTARILLRGLLAEQTIRDLQERIDRALELLESNGCQHWQAATVLRGRKLRMGRKVKP